jgi:PAS domain S-box-containing protein
MLQPLPETESSAYEQLLRAVLKSTADAIVLQDIHGKVLMVNPAGVRLVGVEDEEALIGTDVASRFDARTAAQIAATDRQVVETGVELTYEMLGGFHEPAKTYLVTKTPWRDERGRLVGLVSIAKDITERKRSEEATRVHARKLETLLAVASHDLREPLRAMSALAEILRDDYGPRLDDEGRDLLERIFRGTRRMEDLIDGVSLFMRAHRLTVASRTMDGGAAVAEALRRVEPEIARARASVTVNGPFPSIRADKVWVVEVLFHLLGNALKFTADGHPPVVEIAAWQPDPAAAAQSVVPGEPFGGFVAVGPLAEVGFVVRDRGPGVSGECREKIFSLFRRAVGRDVPGIGVGLAIVREVAERHRGRAFVQTRDGGGSEFVVTFGA